MFLIAVKYVKTSWLTKSFTRDMMRFFKGIVAGTRSGIAEDAKRVFYNTIDALTKEWKKVIYYG